MSNTHNKKKSRNTKNTNTTTEPSDGLSTEVRNQIKAFKEVFPKYKQSTNDDILAIFEEFNNDFNAAVYGVSQGLVKTDCTESWQTAGQKKKKKNTGARGKSATPKNRNDYGDRRAANSNRGQSASRASSRGGRQSNSSRNNTSNDKKQAPPPRVSKQSAAPPSKPTTTAPPRQPAQAPAPKAIPSTQPVTERLSYANVAKSREAWNPNNSGKSATPVSNPQSTKESTTSTSPPKAEEAPVVSSVPSNVQSKPAQPSQAISSNAGNRFNAKPVQERQPRVGVLLPGNFTSDDSMSFQFGNLGLLEEETTTTAASSTEAEHSNNSKAATSTPAPSAPQATSNRVNTQHNKSDQSSKQQPDMSKQNMPGQVPGQEGEMPMGGMPMSQYPYPMYPVGMEAMDPNARPMPFYPEQYSAYQRGDGKYPRAASNTQGRDTSSSKFNAENGGDKNASSGSQAATAAAAQQTPYPYGPYPMYGHPFVPNQFHGGSYGNQFYPGFYKNPPGFPPGGFQSFGNTGMGYAQEDEYRKMAGQYYSQDGNPSPLPQSGNAPQASSGKTSAQTTSPPKQSQGALEGAPGGYQSTPPGFKNQAGAGDYYPADMYTMGSSFATPQPFGYPPMGQQAYQPQQPQQPQQSSQSSNSQSRNY